MNPANLEKPTTAAGKVYTVLKERGDWVDGWTLTRAANVIAVSTWVSSIRLRLEMEPERMERIEVRRTKLGWDYRIARVEPKGQMELVV